MYCRGSWIKLSKRAKGRNLELAYHKPLTFASLMMDNQAPPGGYDLLITLVYYPSGCISLLAYSKVPNHRVLVADDEKYGVPMGEQHTV